MEITRRTDYAMRMLMELAANDGSPISVRELAERGDVPYAFARAVQRDLVGAKLVESRRGAQGGICLARPAEDITLLDVVTAMQGVPTVSPCAEDSDWCTRSGGCSLHGVWCGANEVLQGYLQDRTLAGLIDERRR